MSSDNNQQNKISQPVIAIVGLCIVFSVVLLGEISLNLAFWCAFASCFVILLIVDRIIWSVVASVLFGVVYSILTVNSWESASGYTSEHLVLRVFMGMLVAVIWGALAGFAIRRVHSWLNFVRHKQIRN